MTKRVLDVGNCTPDHAAIRHLIEKHFDAKVDQADHTAGALQYLHREDYALVLVNRKLDCDYSDGLDVIREIRGRSEFTGVPVMMVTNFEEHQATAVEAGAVPGFGKNALHSPATVELLRTYLD